MNVLKAILSRMWRDWEKTLCRLLGLALALCLLQWIWGVFGEEQGGTTTKGATPTQRPLFNSGNAFAFLKPPPVYEDKEHAFLASLRLQARPAARAWGTRTFSAPKAPEPPKVEPPKVVAPTPTPPPTPPPVVAPPPPPKPKRTQTVEYRGCMTSASGKQLALVQNVTSKKVAYVQKGDKLGDVTVGDFSAQSLTVLDGKGQESAVDFGKQKTITVE